jgi:hypothetical protein
MSELQKNMRDEEVSYYQDPHPRDNSLRQCYYDIINQSAQPVEPKGMVIIMTEVESLLSGQEKKYEALCKDVEVTKIADLLFGKGGGPTLAQVLNFCYLNF